MLLFENTWKRKRKIKYYLNYWNPKILCHKQTGLIYFEEINFEIKFELKFNEFSIILIQSKQFFKMKYFIYLWNNRDITSFKKSKNIF